MISFHEKTNKGFTLVEVMVAVSIFAIIVTVGIGALLNMNLAYAKSRSQQQVMDQLNFVLETMMREIRTGNTYHCEPDNDVYQSFPQDCNSPVDGGRSFSFLQVEDSLGNAHETVYRLGNSGQVERSINGNSFMSLTPEELRIEDMRFRVYGAESGDASQPLVVVSLLGTSTIRQQATNFAIQMSVTQRQLDFPQ
jgi:prepilin-type N-terminal cleavage/methylation domain-containing protein